MPAAGSITRLIGEAKAGNPDAIQKLWDAYFKRLLGIARKRLRGRRSDMAEDAVVSAFATFWRRAKDGYFPQLSDRDNLWPLLAKITDRKAINLFRKHIRDDVELPDSSQFPLGRQPDPRDDIAIVEAVKELLEQLGDDTLRSIAIWKLEAYTNEEIARKLNRSVGTVERKLRLIRSILKRKTA